MGRCIICIIRVFATCTSSKMHLVWDVTKTWNGERKSGNEWSAVTFIKMAGTSFLWRLPLTTRSQTFVPRSSLTVPRFLFY